MHDRQIKRRIPETQRKTQQIAVRLTQDELEALQEIADREGLPVAYFVREGIELAIKQYSRKP